MPAGSAQLFGNCSPTPTVEGSISYSSGRWTGSAARRAGDAPEALQRLTWYGVGWKSLTEEYLDSAGVFKDAIVSIMAMLAKQERVKISERTKAGLARTRAQGKQFGRPKNVFDRQKAVEMRRSGASLSVIADAVGISRSQAFRVTRDYRPRGG